jgi:hypothetical protein
MYYTMKPSKPNYDRQAQENGDWIRVSIPPEIADHLNLEPGDTLRFQEEKGQHGPYASLWNPEQQEEQVEEE